MWDSRSEARSTAPPSNPPLQFCKQSLPSYPRVGAGFFVCVVCVRSFTGAHEAVTRSFVCDRVVSFAGGFHRSDGVWDCRVDARVVAGVEAVNGRGDAGHRVFLRRAAVEDERRGKIFAVGGEAEGLRTAPAEATDRKRAV